MRHAVLVLLALAACTGDTPDRDAVTDSTAVDAATGPPITVLGESQQSSWEEAMDVVVTNATSWEAAWSHLHDGVSPPPSLPPVDFVTQRVLIVAAGMRPSGGFSLAMTDHVVSADTIHVDIAIGAPGAGCGVTAALTAPTLVLAIPIAPGPVVVRRTERVVECRE